MTEHDLKSWPESFLPVFNGINKFELRKNDRGYKIGDRLRLREWEPKTYTYSGRECWREITFVLEGVGLGLGCIAPYKGLEHGYCILSLR